jgi:hypothetical protein
MRPPYGVPYVLQLMKRSEPCQFIIYSVVRPTVLVGNRRVSRNLLAVHDNFLDESELLGDGAPAVHGASEPNIRKALLAGSRGFRVWWWCRQHTGCDGPPNNSRES